MHLDPYRPGVNRRLYMTGALQDPFQEVHVMLDQ